ncbi:MAG: hypothetical protein OJF59_001709 [Cytophagales bacterium]|nr:MAG: hypothetical protein OJF59_001709 [Cytophagales bacterium]
MFAMLFFEYFIKPDFYAKFDWRATMLSHTYSSPITYDIN